MNMEMMSSGEIVTKSEWYIQNLNCRSSRPEAFCEKGVLEGFAEFTGKQLCLRPATLLKKRLWKRDYLFQTFS